MTTPILGGTLTSLGSGLGAGKGRGGGGIGNRKINPNKRGKMARAMQPVEFGTAALGLLDGISANKAGRPVPETAKNLMVGYGARQHIPNYKPGQVQAVMRAPGGGGMRPPRPPMPDPALYTTSGLTDTGYVNPGPGGVPGGMPGWAGGPGDLIPPGVTHTPGGGADSEALWQQFLRSAQGRRAFGASRSPFG